MNVNAERLCRERIETAIQGVDADDAMAALITALVDHVMSFDKDGAPISLPEVKRLLGEVIDPIVDLCFAFDQHETGPVQ
jgi:hypothetical protein